MSAETIGRISGFMVVASAIPYIWRVCQGKIKPQLTSWVLWTFIGLALLVTYKSSGAKSNAWPAVFGFTNPLIVTAIVLYKYRSWTRLERLEKFCLAFGIVSLAVWLFVRGEKELAQYALYLAIAADLCAAIPTISFILKNPEEERPFAWGCFAIGYGLGVFAVTEPTFANYALPIYMFVGALCVAFPLARYRWREGYPLTEWI